MKKEDNKPTALRPLSGIAAQKQSELRLMIVLGEDVRSQLLLEEGTFTIGRSTDSEINISDSTISRHHAILTTGEKMYIEDNGSLNGTWVHRRRLAAGERVEFGPGEIIEVGDAMLVIQRKLVPQKPLRIQEHRFFQARLEEELEKAKRAATALAILLVRVGGNVPEDVMSNAIRMAFRDSDIIAGGEKSGYEILLPEATPAMVDTMVRRFTHSLGGYQADVRCGLACFPRDAASTEDLVDRARKNLDEAHAVEEAGPFVMEDEKMLGLRRLIERIAPTGINVIVRGETGVGKELVARLIHRLSGRPKNLFVSVNCASLPDSLLESELFGHEKGAFTGATRTKPGLLETAGEGTFLLDEISEMPLNLQAKLLRMLEERKATRIGGLKPYRIGARFIATSNRNLEEEVQQGTFRQDLYFRLDGITLHIPPLRDRICEIEPLAKLFVKQTFRQLGRKQEPSLTSEALAWLRAYPWPGNVRELRNVIERSALFATGGRITRDLVAVEDAVSTATETPPPLPPDMVAKRKTRLSLPRLDAGARSVWEEVQDLEHQRILEALDKTGGNQTKAAELLGISRRTLINRLEKYGIQRPRKKTDKTK